MKPQNRKRNCEGVERFCALQSCGAATKVPENLVVLTGGRMRTFLSGLAALCIAASPAAGQATINAMSAGKIADIDAPCRIPFEKLKDTKTGTPFPLSAALNENEKLPAHLRGRYIVGDFNSADENGMCKGVKEYLTRLDQLSEFPRLRRIAAERNIEFTSLAKENVAALARAEETLDDFEALSFELDDLRNYLEQVKRFETDHIVKARVYNGWCVGQTLNFCEIQNGKPKLVYRFITSRAAGSSAPTTNITRRST